MNLHCHNAGIFYRGTTEQVAEPHLGIKIDYWYMAKRTSRTSRIIDLLICTIIFDHTGNHFECKSVHQGEYEPWREVIQSRLEAHMNKVGVDRLMAKRICREINISKDKLVPFNKQDFLHKKRNSW